MHKDVVSNADMTIFAEIGIGIFVVVFLMIIARALFMKSDRVEHMENLPLEDGQQTDADRPKEAYQ